MRPTIAWLRTGLLLGGGALVLVLVGILGWAHLRAHQELRDLPGRLGADIQREANGFTYSQTVGGRVLFTLHAKRATQHKTGAAQLEDAGLVLYGDHDGRADRIYGKNFLYDQRAGVVKAVGVVRLDLAAPAPTDAAERLRFASGGELSAKERAAAEGQMVQAVTSGLVYTQSTGVATTAEGVHFTFRGLNGDAEGATYQTRDGSVTLERAVQFAGQQDGRAFRVTASHAVLHRSENRVLLSDADVHLTRDGVAGEQEVRAAQLLLRPDVQGGMGLVEGSGGVELRSAETTVRAPEGVLELARGQRPVAFRMRGGVHLERVSGGERVMGTAAQCASRFDEDGRLTEEVFQNGVKVVMERGETTREIAGQSVSLSLTGEQTLRQATVDGDAAVRIAGRDGVLSSLTGERVVAEFVQRGAETALQQVTAAGSASLRRQEQGLVETSRAGRIEATFAGTGKGGADVAIARLVESGGVVLDREGRHGKSGEVERTHAVAQTATYGAETEKMSLSGAAEISEPGRVLKADRVVVEQKTGDAVAEGAVQATLVSQPVLTGGSAAKEPVHMVGARAVLQRAAGVLTVFGAGSGNARMWEGAAQVQAPALLLRQADGTMDAYGPEGGAAQPVQVILPAGAGAAATTDPRQGGVVRIRSGRVHFVNGADSAKEGGAGARRVEFSGGVTMLGMEGTVRARQAVAMLGGVSAGKRAGGLERVVAQGEVRVQQPGRVATGEELVWTTGDGTLVLTGTASAPPRVTDEASGTVSGGAIQLHTGDNSVVVTGAGSGVGHGRVQTETRLQKR